MQTNCERSETEQRYIFWMIIL